ncbi:hypothetical protein B0H67DRAFT_571287 [Lasiosphaeris hirsuta]|uniref:Secreted protein n=1 Tax=Lasiosphaeris hirsuta TaxID=260670 RepID=A0AA40B121_9PEZI|nr:hypothetical protein B0H67DRAFT_571287 [Lasiosphaeris hirsuta]
MLWRDITRIPPLSPSFPTFFFFFFLLLPFASCSRPGLGSKRAARRVKSKGIDRPQPTIQIGRWRRTQTRDTGTARDTEEGKNEINKKRRRKKKIPRKRTRENSLT